MERMTNFMRVKKRPVQLKDDTKADHKQQKTVHQSPVAHTVSGKRTVDVKSAIHERSSPDEEDPTEYVPEFIYKVIRIAPFDFHSVGDVMRDRVESIACFRLSSTSTRMLNARSPMKNKPSSSISR